MKIELDYKITVWRKAFYDIPDSDLPEFLKSVKQFGIDLEHEGFVEDEIIYETEELILPSENNGLPTIELFANHNLIWSNDKT